MDKDDFEKMYKLATDEAQAMFENAGRVKGKAFLGFTFICFNILQLNKMAAAHGFVIGEKCCALNHIAQVVESTIVQEVAQLAGLSNEERDEGVRLADAIEKKMDSLINMGGNRG